MWTTTNVAAIERHVPNHPADADFLNAVRAFLSAEPQKFNTFIQAVHNLWKEAAKLGPLTENERLGRAWVEMVRNGVTAWRARYSADMRKPPEKDLGKFSVILVGAGTDPESVLIDHPEPDYETAANELLRELEYAWLQNVVYLKGE